MKCSSELTVDEIIALLKRTSLPTIVVEGRDDLIVYRRFEERLAHLGVSVLPVGGRGKLLEVFSRRAEVPASIRLAFVTDQDVWVNIGVPATYRDPRLVLTWGYSIENDLFSDGQLITLLTAAESVQFGTELDAFVEWYALALSRHLVNAALPIALHPDQVLNPTQRNGLLALNPGEAYPAALRVQMLGDYSRLLRGKSLLALLLRHASYPGRQPRHSLRALLEWVATRPGPLLRRVAQELEAVMS